MKTKIKEEILTNCLGFDLILAVDENYYLIGARTEEGGSYPLLDFELDEICRHLAIQREGRDYSHLYAELD